jgi:hypothetical protein
MTRKRRVGDLPDGVWQIGSQRKIPDTVWTIRGQVADIVCQIRTGSPARPGLHLIEGITTVQRSIRERWTEEKTDG